MNIGIVASEGVPFSKTGGLADVTGALFKIFSEKDNNCYLILPYYKTTKNVISTFDKTFNFEFNLGEKKVGGRFLLKEFYRNGRVVFIENDYYFGRDFLYGEKGVDYPDNAERFGFFNKAVSKIIEENIINVDILHLNDWQTGLIPIFLKQKNLKVKTLFTIHNLAYQGNFNADVLNILGIDPELFRLDGIEFYGKVSFLKSGIVFSDKISTVSPSYAREILSEEFGEKMEGILRTRRKDLVGILNGIDYDIWNPETDKYIYRNYNTKSFLEEKELNKISFIKEIGMGNNSLPLFGMVGRIASQKGLDILAEALKKFLKEEVLFVLLGTGEKHLEDILKEIAMSFNGKLKLILDFNEELAHKIYASSDFFVMPSKYEPCGLGQLIALKYGTLPIVHAVGGLKDTVDNFNEFTLCGNGISFEYYSTEDLLNALYKANKIFKNKEVFNEMRKRAMNCDFSWNSSANSYIKVFEEIINK